MQINYMDAQQVLELFPARDPHSHKGNYGKLLLLCGSEGFTGAAELAAKGALRTGAGLVYIGVPESIYTIEAAKLTEPVVFPLPDKNGKMAKGAWKKIRQRLSGVNAVLVGCGIGISAGTTYIVKKLLKAYQGTIILDADGINVLCAHKDILRGRTGKTVLTPHEGEFCRFTGKKQILDRINDSAELAKDLGIAVVLKGHHTVITDGKACYINKTGNPGMAVGGSGDLLAGIITGIIGQGVEPVKAAAAAAWLHGKAGDICSREIGEYAMLPTDMLDVLPRLLKKA